MTYTYAQTEPLAQRLVADLPGLDIRLARAWIHAESGVGNNPLGVTHVVNGKTVLMTYATPQAGIDAAANLIKTSSHYSCIRAAIAGGNVRQQALAVIASPWNTPGSPYYTAQFTAARLLGNPLATATTPPGAAPGPAAAAPYTPGPGAGLNLPTLPDVPGTIVQVTTYALAIVLVGFGIFLYSKGGGQQQVVVVPS